MNLEWGDIGKWRRDWQCLHSSVTRSKLKRG
jgi:hypothetical protein